MSDIQDRLIPVNLEQEMKKSFISYAMAVIINRALPDVRDGLKPVHRRILYAMNELGMTPDKPFRKSARIVGDVLGKYHPHGDTAVYDAMVRLAQDFNTRYMLVEGQGNFGSVDGDGAAAMRYTEARMSKITLSLIGEIDKDTVDFMPNFDETLMQPTVLPSRFPNLLVNGSSGIAVGMATNIPPHNLTEVINAAICLMDNPDASLDDLMEHVKGPDFPTGGIILGRIDLKRDVQPQVVLNSLYKHTQLQDTFGVIMLALVHGEPKILSLRDMLYWYIEHQKDVVTRRTKYDLDKSLARAHILEGLLKAMDSIDEIVHIIRHSKDVPSAKAELIARFEFTDKQAQAILDMRLARLTNLELDKLLAEYQELEKTIAYLNSILADEHLLLSVIKDELGQIRDKFGDDRRTEISAVEGEIDVEDLIARDDMVVTLTHFGYVKRLPKSTYHAQNRGGKGVTGQSLREEDYAEQIRVVNTHEDIMFFTNRGRCYMMKCFQIPEAGRTARGTAIINLLQLQSGEKVTTMIPMPDMPEGHYLMMATRQGLIKKTPLEEFANLRKSGLIAIILREDDELVSVELTDGNRELLLGSRQGKAIRFNENNVRAMGRASQGVRSMKLREDDAVISMCVLDEDEKVLSITENGYGKRTDPAEYREQGRGGQGVIAMNLTDKTGLLAAQLMIAEDEDILLITDDGTIIRTAADSIRICGRATQGVRLMRVGDGSRIVGVARAEKEDEDDETDAPENAAEESDAGEDVSAEPNEEI